MSNPIGEGFGKLIEGGAKALSFQAAIIRALIIALVVVLVLALVLGFAVGRATAAEALTPDLASYKVPTAYIDPLADVRGHCIKWEKEWEAHGITTAAHENTHQVNSEMRNNLKVECAFYCLNDRAFVATQPRSVTLGDVAAQIKATTITDERDYDFKTYLVDARQWWDREPLTLVDEAVAYTNGSIAGLYHNEEFRWQESSVKATKLTAWSLDLCDVIAHREPTYDVKRLRLFILWNARRIPRPVYPNGPKPEAWRQSFDRRPLPAPSPMLPFPWYNANESVHKKGLETGNQPPSQTIKGRPDDASRSRGRTGQGYGLGNGKQPKARNMDSRGRKRSFRFLPRL